MGCECASHTAGCTQSINFANTSSALWGTQHYSTCGSRVPKLLGPQILKQPELLWCLYRVLQPGGTFLLVSLGDPSRRLPLLCDPRLPWKVTLLLLPKISAANQAYVDGK